MPTIDDREALSYFSLFVNDIQIFDTKEEIPSKKNQYHCCKLFLRVNKKKIQFISNLKNKYEWRKIR